MRDLRFRAWDGHKWVYVTLQPHAVVQPIMNEGVTYEWLQSTGLKDHNDVAIWEGDIIQFPSVTGPEHTRVWFDKGAFIIHNRAGYATAIGDLLYVFPCEVIGNTDENPDLLQS